MNGNKIVSNYGSYKNAVIEEALSGAAARTGDFKEKII